MQIGYTDACLKYGQVDLVTKFWPDEKKHMVLLYLPKELLFPNWIHSFTGKPVDHIYCNKDMESFLLLALANLKWRGLETELKTFDGCFNIRAVRGYTARLSAHCYGLAIDLNAKENPLGGPVALSKEFVKCFTDAGFSWGGDFDRCDGQHFSYAWE